MKQKSPIVSWLGLNRSLGQQKNLSVLLGIINAVLVLILCFHVLAPPLVIVYDRGEKNFMQAKRLNVEVTTSDLEKVASEFVIARYQWDQFDKNSILKGITPIISKNLVRKVEKELTKLSKQFPKDKLISQSIANLKTNVSMEKILISFDRILKVDGIPLVTPIEIEFLMKEDKANYLNPLGIYINNLVQYEAI